MDVEEVASQKYFAVIWIDFDRSIEQLLKDLLENLILFKSYLMTFPPNPPHDSSCLLTPLICYQFQLGLILHISQPILKRFNRNEKERLNWRGLDDGPLDETCCWVVDTELPAADVSFVMNAILSYKILNKIKVSTVARRTMSRRESVGGRIRRRKKKKQEV